MSFVIRTRGIGNIAPLIPVQGTKGNISTQSVVLGSILLIPSPLAVISDRATPTVVLGSLIVDNPISNAVSTTKGFTYEIAGKRKVKFTRL